MQVSSANTYINPFLGLNNGFTASRVLAGPAVIAQQQIPQVSGFDVLSAIVGSVINGISVPTTPAVTGQVAQAPAQLTLAQRIAATLEGIDVANLAQSDFMNQALLDVANTSTVDAELVKFAVDNGTQFVTTDQLNDDIEGLSEGERASLRERFEESPGTLALAATFGDGSRAIIFNEERIRASAERQGKDPAELAAEIMSEELNHINDQATRDDGTVSLFDEAVLKLMHQVKMGEDVSDEEIADSIASTARAYAGSTLDESDMEDVLAQASDLVNAMSDRFGAEGAAAAEDFMNRFVSEFEAQGLMDGDAETIAASDLLEATPPVASVIPPQSGPAASLLVNNSPIAAGVQPIFSFALSLDDLLATELEAAEGRQIALARANV